MDRAKLARDALSLKRSKIKSIKENLIENLCQNSVEEEEEEEFHKQHDYVSEIRSLKATIAHLRNVIVHHKIAEHRKLILQKNIQNTKEHQDSDEENDHEYQHSHIKQLFIETILDNYDQNKYDREYPKEFVHLCFCLYTISPHAYILLRELFDLPCETVLKNYFSKKVQIEKDKLTDISRISEIITDYRYTYKVHKEFDAVLGVDAASFDRKNGDGKKFIFTFYLLPINPELKTIPIYVYPTKNGRAHADIIFIFDKLISILHECGINIIYTATDGDTYYNHINEETFDIFVIEAFKGGFYAAIEAWEENPSIKRINDMLHCIKLARKRLIIGDVVLNSKKLINQINAQTFEEILKLGNTLTDDSDFAKMSDYYALNFFSFQNLEILLNKNQYDLALYLLPFTCWSEALINQSISKKIRLNLLQISFDILYQFYLQNNLEPRKKGITLTNVEGSEALTFADNNFIIRCLNSIVGTGYVLIKYDDIGLDRIGTQIIENFFGRVRISCNHYDSYERILSAISHTLLRNNILTQYDIHLQIEKRVNTGGIHISQSQTTESNNFDEIVFISSLLFQLTGVTRKTEDEDSIMTKYEIVKKEFLELIDQTKDDVKKLFRPPRSKKSSITFRCETCNE